MLRQLLRYAALSTALFYNACILPEEESENPCANGEVLFEDEFEGSELDEGKWEPEVCGAEANYRLREGILELNVGNGNCGLQSRSTYTLDDRTLCFEARWKVREREGVDFGFGMDQIDQAGITFFFGYGNNNLQFGSGIVGGCDNGSEYKRIDLTQFHNYKTQINLNEIAFYIDERPVGNSQCIPRNIPLNISASCQSSDESEKRCYLDYIRLLAE